MLPDYADMLTARHRAHERELREMVAAMPIEAGQHVIDGGCGDGAWSAWLAERVGPTGKVTAIDVDQAFLRLARLHTAHPVRVLEGDATSLPFDTDSADAALCAHSLYDLDDPGCVLRELGRVVRPRGKICIVSADVLRHVQLPWPPELELELASAVQKSLEAEKDPRPFLPRQAPELLRSAGLEVERHEVFATTRTGPLAADERHYLRGWLEGLIDMAGDQLDASRADAVRDWTTDAQLSDESFSVVYNDQLTVASVPTDLEDQTTG